MFCPPPLPTTGRTRNSSPLSRTADRSYAIVRYVALRLPEIIAIVLALRRSPTLPRSGLLGIGVPDVGRTAFSESADCEENSAISAEKNAIKVQGRNIGRSHSPMTLPLQQLLGARHTQPYAPQHCLRVGGSRSRAWCASR